MINSINGLTTKTNDSAKTDSVDVEPVKNSTNPAETTESNSDSVEISASAQQFGQLIDKVRALPDIDQQRVESLQAAISEGQYQIDADSLAQSIIDFEL